MAVSGTEWEVYYHRRHPLLLIIIIKMSSSHHHHHQQQQQQHRLQRLQQPIHDQANSSCDRIQQWYRNRKHFVDAHNIETLLHSAAGHQGTLRPIKLATKVNWTNVHYIELDYQDQILVNERYFNSWKCTGKHNFRKGCAAFGLGLKMVTYLCHSPCGVQTSSPWSRRTIVWPGMRLKDKTKTIVFPSTGTNILAFRFQ